MPDSRPPQPASRRSLLAAGAALSTLLVTGCEFTLDSGPAQQRRVEVAHDVNLARDVATRLQHSVDQLQSSLRERAAARPDFSGVRQAQAAHLRVLHRMLPAAQRPPSRSRPSVPRAALLNRVQADRMFLFAAAEQARTGEFAQLLAAMAACLTQHQIAQRFPQTPATGGASPESAPAPAAGSENSADAAQTDAAKVDALNKALAAEHAAIWVYGVLGARTSVTEQPDLTEHIDAAHDAHRVERDRLAARIRDLGGQPEPAAAAYTPPRTRSVDEVRAAALQIEKSSAQTYGTLVAETATVDRARAIGSLDKSAARQMPFRGSPEIFPGASLSDD